MQRRAVHRQEGVAVRAGSRASIPKALIWPLTLLWVTPYLWMVMAAFKSRLDVTARPPRLLFSPTLENFALSYNGQPIVPLFANTFVIATGTALLTLLLGVPAAYFFARRRSGGTRNLFLFVLATRIAPPIALSLPFFIVFTQVGLRGTYAAVVIIHSVFNLSFVIWLLEGFFADVPVEIEMAAQVDGRTRTGAFFYAVLPQIRLGVGTTALFTFIFSWNEYMMASLLSSSATRPVTPALPGFIAQASTQWGSFCAVATLSSLPVLALVVLARRQLARGLTAGVVHK
jgi:multiple sugar transport system permease protein